MKRVVIWCIFGQCLEYNFVPNVHSSYYKKLVSGLPGADLPLSNVGMYDVTTTLPTLTHCLY